jgi:hypothetical protein
MIKFASEGSHAITTNPDTVTNNSENALQSHKYIMSFNYNSTTGVRSVNLTANGFIYHDKLATIQNFTNTTSIPFNYSYPTIKNLKVDSANGVTSLTRIKIITIYKNEFNSFLRTINYGGPSTYGFSFGFPDVKPKLFYNFVPFEMKTTVDVSTTNLTTTTISGLTGRNTVWQPFLNISSVSTTNIYVGFRAYHSLQMDTPGTQTNYGTNNTLIGLPYYDNNTYNFQAAALTRYIPAASNSAATATRLSDGSTLNASHNSYFLSTLGFNLPQVAQTLATMTYATLHPSITISILHTFNFTLTYFKTYDDINDSSIVPVRVASAATPIPRITYQPYITNPNHVPIYYSFYLAGN